jgi:hypothetical protein
VSHNGHDDIATRLRREAAAAAPERLRADVMVQVHAEPRPQRIRARRSFGRSFASVVAAACILGALVFGMSRVDFGGSGSSSGAGGGTSAAAELQGALRAAGPSKAATSSQSGFGAAKRMDAVPTQALSLARVPGPLRAAIDGRASLAAPLRHTFGALDPYHLRSGR